MGAFMAGGFVVDDVYRSCCEGEEEAKKTARCNFVEFGPSSVLALTDWGNFWQGKKNQCRMAR